MSDFQLLVLAMFYCIVGTALLRQGKKKWGVYPVGLTLGFYLCAIFMGIQALQAIILILLRL